VRRRRRAVACLQQERAAELPIRSAGYHVRGDKVYYLASFPGKALEVGGVDVASFEAGDGTYARDKLTVYFTKDGRTVHVNGNAIGGADPSTFRVLAGAYAQDAGHVFYFADQIVDADAASFRPRAYYRDTVIADADPGTFPQARRSPDVTRGQSRSRTSRFAATSSCR
jgi:hypothetical protein